MSNDRYCAFMGLAPKHIPHWEHWSCPDAETYLTGIDYYEHPRLCRLRLYELYPQLELPIPETDAPLPRPELDLVGKSSAVDAEGRHYVRWGDGMTTQWDWGEHFKTAEDVFAFSPLAQGDFTDIPVVESRDYRDEDRLYREYRAHYPETWGDQAPEGSSASARGGIPAVQYAITDRAAIELARTFYESLVDGLPVDAAVVESRVAISLAAHNTMEWGTPVLYMRSPDGVLFKMQEAESKEYES